MGRGYTGAMMRAFGAGEWVLTVLSTEDVTPHYRRIVVDAPGVFDGTPYGPASYLRLWAPDPDDPSKEFQRGYTIASCDEATEQMTLEFVLHEPASPACRWAERARPGDQIAATRWGAPRFVPPSPAPAGYLLSATSPHCPLLLLDEATVLVVAHRLSTIARADQITFLENGRIVEQAASWTLTG